MRVAQSSPNMRDQISRQGNVDIYIYINKNKNKNTGEPKRHEQDTKHNDTKQRKRGGMRGLSQLRAPCDGGSTENDRKKREREMGAMQRVVVVVVVVRVEMEGNDAARTGGT